jgi:hypothetical protein
MVWFEAGIRWPPWLWVVPSPLQPAGRRKVVADEFGRGRDDFLRVDQLHRVEADSPQERNEPMTSQNFATAFVVDQTPDEAFAAITNVRGWWSGEIEGRTDAKGEVFTYRYEDIHYSKQQVSELLPGRKVVWQIVDSQLNFTEDPNEWTGTEVVFEVVPAGGQTEVRFSHVGLTPEFECYDQCTSAWAFYINNSLRQLITTGQGAPNAKESPAA